VKSGCIVRNSNPSLKISLSWVIQVAKRERKKKHFFFAKFSKTGGNFCQFFAFLRMTIFQFFCKKNLFSESSRGLFFLLTAPHLVTMNLKKYVMCVLRIKLEGLALVFFFFSSLPNSPPHCEGQNHHLPPSPGSPHSSRLFLPRSWF